MENLEKLLEKDSNGEYSNLKQYIESSNDKAKLLFKNIPLNLIIEMHKKLEEATGITLLSLYKLYKYLNIQDKDLRKFIFKKIRNKNNATKENDMDKIKEADTYIIILGNNNDTGGWDVKCKINMLDEALMPMITAMKEGIEALKNRLLDIINKD